jgi:glycosyltransferase involved in cell wall biosynthesis
VLISEVQGPIKVSVVVPVFNAGEHITASVDSLLAQTMAADELELIFVDDGSTDGSPALLDRLAADHPHVRVFHEPPSGWPGRPRNVGLTAAVGEYVQFLDQDDSLGEEALARLYAMARRNSSDIVIGKMIGVNRRVPVQLFRRSRDNATIHDSQIIDSLTPHKMFRREFLLKTGLRFPEGPRRLEDHVFVVAAYFAAQRISVLSDYPCYYHITRDDQGNAARRPFDPRSYLAYLSEALDVVDANTDPGPARDRLHRRWMRVEIVQRLRGRRLLRADEDFRDTFAREARAVVLDRFAPGVDAGLQPLDRLAAALLRAGDLATLKQVAEWETDLRVRARLDSARWRDGALVLDVSAGLVDGEGKPVELTNHGGSRVLTPPLPPDVLAALPAGTLDAGEGAVTLNIFARQRGGGVTQFLSGGAALEDSLVLHATSTTCLPVTARSGDVEPLTDGVWEIVADWRGFGWMFKPRVTTPAAPGATEAVEGPALLGDGPRLARLRRAARGPVQVELATASLAVPDAGPKIRVDRARSTASSTRRRATRLDLTLHLATDRSRQVTVRLAQGGTGQGQLWPAVLSPLDTGDGGAAASRLSTTIAHPRVPAGLWTLHLSFGDVADALPIRCPLTVTRRGSVRIGKEATPTARSRVLALLPAGVARRLRTLRRWAMSTRARRAG